MEVNRSRAYGGTVTSFVVAAMGVGIKNSLPLLLMHLSAL
jgi:hypothetical protein